MFGLSEYFLLFSVNCVQFSTPWARYTLATKSTKRRQMWQIGNKLATKLTFWFVAGLSKSIVAGSFGFVDRLAVDVVAKVEHVQLGRLCQKWFIFVARMSNDLSTCRQCVPDKSHTVDCVDFLQSQPCRIDFVACMYQPLVKLTVASSMVCYCSPLITAGGWAPHTWTCLCRLDYVRGTIVLTICVSVSLMVRFTSNKDQNIPQWTICRPVTFLTLKDRDQRPESHENTEIVF